MLHLLAVVGGVVGLVALAWREQEEPVVKPELMKMRLAALARVPPAKLTFSQASDGVVLSRRLGERELETRFAKLVSKMQKSRRSR